MLPPVCADTLLRHAQEHDDALVASLQDAATYRYMAHTALALWYAERQHRLRLEQRLRDFMGDRSGRT